MVLLHAEGRRQLIAYPVGQYRTGAREDVFACTGLHDADGITRSTGIARSERAANSGLRKVGQTTMQVSAQSLYRRHFARSGRLSAGGAGDAGEGQDVRPARHGFLGPCPRRYRHLRP
jgi:hypothetical protein